MIGVLMRPSISEENNKTHVLYHDIYKNIINNGAIPICIVSDNYNNAIKLIKMCDGVILQGGDNFTLDDIRIVSYLYDNDIPTFGICLGMQIMGCLFGGSLENINSNINHKQKSNYAHIVNIEKNSLLYKIVKCNKIMVNSRHKEYLLNTKLKCTSYSEDGIVESIEDDSKTFFLGVQWHPESMTEYDIVENTIFKYFIWGCLNGFNGNIKDS